MTTRTELTLIAFLIFIGARFAVAGDTDSDGDGVPDDADVCCNTPLDVPVDSQGRPLGDFDLDCDVDLLDFATFADCFTGPLGPCLIDECTVGTHECDPNATCTDPPDGYECACFPGYVDCDSSPGCEVDLNTPVNTCATAEYVGAACGDTNMGTFCPSTDWYEFATKTGRGSKWFRTTVTECSSCCAWLNQWIDLLDTSQPPTNYDLYVYDACGQPPAETHACGYAMEELGQSPVFFSSSCPARQVGYVPVGRGGGAAAVACGDPRLHPPVRCAAAAHPTGWTVRRAQERWVAGGVGGGRISQGEPERTPGTDLLNQAVGPGRERPRKTVIRGGKRLWIQAWSE